MLDLLLPYHKITEKYQFQDPPILLGGFAMQYYNLRLCGHDLDMMISKRDRDNLLKLGYKLNLFGGKTPQEVDSTFSNIRNLHLDLVITLNQYDYDFFKHQSIPCPLDNNLLIISLENLMITKIFAQRYSPLPKHKEDVELVMLGIEKKQYPHLNN